MSTYLCVSVRMEAYRSVSVSYRIECVRARPVDVLVSAVGVESEMEVEVVNTNE